MNTNIRHTLRKMRRATSLIVSGIALLGTPLAHALNLSQCYELALQQDARFQAARADTAATRELEAQARAQLLPNVNINLSRNENRLDSTVPGFLGRLQKSHQDYFGSSYVIGLRQPLFRFYNIALLQQAQSQVSSAEAILDSNLQDLLVRLSGAYFEALMATDQLNLVLAQKDAYGMQLQAAKRSFSAGQGTRTDIDDAQARYDMTLAQELEVNQNVDYTRHQLQVIINQPVGNLARLDSRRLELVSPKPEKIEDWVARGEAENAELRAMRANIDAAERETAKARAGHMPTVDLVVQRSRSQSENQNTINQLYLNTMAGIQVNIPIFSGGYNTSQIRQTEAALDKVRMQYEGRRREIGLQIRKEFQNVAQGVLKVRALEQAERSADQAVYSNQKGRQAGMRSEIDILNAQQQRMNARRDLAQARYQYIVARLRLQSLVGSLNETEIAAVNNWLMPEVAAPALPESSPSAESQTAPSSPPIEKSAVSQPTKARSHLKEGMLAEVQPLQPALMAIKLACNPGTDSNPNPSPIVKKSLGMTSNLSLMKIGRCDEKPSGVNLASRALFKPTVTTEVALLRY